MSANTCCGVLFVASLFAMTYAFVPVRPMSMSSSPTWYAPRYDTSCRESIADLKALIDITNSLRHENNSYTCETCARTFNEEVILKLINALVITATRNCGLDGRHQPYGSNNIGVWNAGGGYMGGNTIVVGGPIPTTEAGGPIPTTEAGGPEATNNSICESINEALIRLGVLDGDDTAGADIDNASLPEGNVGKRAANNSCQNETESEDNKSLLNVGVLDGGKTAGLDVAGSNIAAINVANIVGGKNTTNNKKIKKVTNDVDTDKTVPKASNKSVAPVSNTPATAEDDTVSTAKNSTDKAE